MGPGPVCELCEKLFIALPPGPDGFPHKKFFPHGSRFAYVIPLTLGRARVNVTHVAHPWTVDDFF